MITKDNQNNEEKESLIKLLKIIDKNNKDENLQLKINNIEQRIIKR